MAAPQPDKLSQFSQVLREEKRRVLAGLRHKTIVTQIFILLDKVADIILQLSIPQLTDEGEFRGHTPLMPLSAILTFIILTSSSRSLISLEPQLFWYQRPPFWSYFGNFVGLFG